jgi:hypothetical protein
MNNFVDGKCSFANADKLMTVTATNGAGSTDLVLNPKTASLPNSFTTCSVPKTTQNVTAQYSINSSAVRDDGAAGISRRVRTGWTCRAARAGEPAARRRGRCPPPCR